jgi:hypothetical protein
VIKAQLFVPPPGGSEQAELTVQKRCSSGGGACAFTDHVGADALGFGILNSRCSIKIVAPAVLAA